MRNYQLNDIGKLEIEGGRIVSVVEASGSYAEGDFSTEGLASMLIVDVESSLGENSFIRHRIWLPDNWNGIFLAVGNGGFAGVIGTRVCLEAAAGCYAMAQTDMGTSKLRKGEVTLAPEDMWLDYGHRATHNMACVAKQIIAARYGRAADYCYFNGGSAGGLQAFAEFQRYPEDFDGIIARVPSNNGLNLIVYFLWSYLKLRDGKGEPYFTKEDNEKIYSAVLEFFAERGKAKDGYLTHGWAGEDTIDKFLEFLHSRIPEFTKTQLDSLRALYEGPKNQLNGKQIYCGVPFGAEINCHYVDEHCEFGFPWFEVFFGEGFENSRFDFGEMYEQMQKKLGHILCQNSVDLSAFRSHGGKIICYSGGADPFGPWADAVKYYNRTCDSMGGFESVSDFFKYFIIPGRNHGEIGRGLGRVYASEAQDDLVSALRAWCERGVSPEYLFCTKVEDITNGSGEKCGERISLSERVYPYKADMVEGVDFPPSCDGSYLK